MRATVRVEVPQVGARMPRAQPQRSRWASIAARSSSIPTPTLRRARCGGPAAGEVDVYNCLDILRNHADAPVRGISLRSSSLRYGLRHLSPRCPKRWGLAP